MVTLANNHIMDYGENGLNDTVDFLNKSSINFVGAGSIKAFVKETQMFQKNGIKLAIINIAENEWSTINNNKTSGANALDPVSNFYAITDARSKADFVLVITHGGHEMYELPSPRMKSLFRFFVDIGADAVINHHTHTFSGYEIYKDKPIYYSTGNFLFDYPGKRGCDWNKGILVNLTFEKHRVYHSYQYFIQGEENTLFSFVENSTVNENIEMLNCIIQNDEMLEKKFLQYCEFTKKQYLAYLESSSNKYINYLKRKHILPKLNLRKKRLYLNLFRCEAHRDVIIKILENEISNS